MHTADRTDHSNRQTRSYKDSDIGPIPEDWEVEECLEYIVPHELVHLLVRRHDERFVALMDRHLPRWRHVRQTLNAAPLASDTWAPRDIPAMDSRT